MLETVTKETRTATIFSMRSSKLLVCVMAHPSYSDSTSMQEGGMAKPQLGIVAIPSTMPGMNAVRRALLMDENADLCVDFLGTLTGMMMR